MMIFTSIFLITHIVLERKLRSVEKMRHISLHQKRSLSMDDNGHLEAEGLELNRSAMDPKSGLVFNLCLGFT